jgi:hypothetical protein
MKRPLTSLPTPEQIAETPELVALHTLEHVLELTFRTLVSIHPELADPDVPYWAIDPSRTRHVAHRLVMAASHLETQIQGYLAALELDRQTRVERLEDDLPF